MPKYGGKIKNVYDIYLILVTLGYCLRLVKVRFSKECWLLPNWRKKKKKNFPDIYLYYEKIIIKQKFSLLFRLFSWFCSPPWKTSLELITWELDKLSPLSRGRNSEPHLSQSCNQPWFKFSPTINYACIKSNTEIKCLKYSFVI